MRQTGMSPCLTAIDIGRARELPSTRFERSHSTTAHGSPGPTAQRGCLQYHYRKHLPGTCRSCTHPATVCMEEAGRQAGHTLHTRHASESCRRTAAPSEEATDRNAQQSAVVWYGLVAVWATVRDSSHTHRYSPRHLGESTPGQRFLRR